MRSDDPKPGRRARRGLPRALGMLGAFFLLALAGTLALPRPGLHAEAHARGAAEGAVTVRAGTRYPAGPVRRFLLGPGYRRAWGTPVRVEVLDLESFAGGLEPVKRGGGRQTRSLQLVGGDGRTYVFRSVDKDQATGLAPLWRATGGRLRQDQVGALHPGASLAAAGLAEAAGVLQAAPRLVVLPDAAALDSFRADFGGLLGTLEERPRGAGEGAPGFGGALGVVDTEALDSALRAHPGDRVDTLAYLAARLLDVYLGDWDRHEGQWRWARMADGGGHRWAPIPRDRDYAFADYRGPLAALARLADPKIVRFDDRYRDLEGLLVKARPLDRRLLCALPPPAWDSAAAAMRG
ncbi:MAG TPA: hypothetical protein VHG91_08190, partial [Longimicrobium sp.]|nr:hypothetical protein [Longimicrobium sp.]